MTKVYRTAELVEMFGLQWMIYLDMGGEDFGYTIHIRTMYPVKKCKYIEASADHREFKIKPDTFIDAYKFFREFVEDEEKLRLHILDQYSGMASSLLGGKRGRKRTV